MSIYFQWHTFTFFALKQRLNFPKVRKTALGLPTVSTAFVGVERQILKLCLRIIKAQLADDEVFDYFCASAIAKKLKTTAMTVNIDEVKI